MCSVVEEQIKGHSFVWEGRVLLGVVFNVSCLYVCEKKGSLQDGSMSNKKSIHFHFVLGHFSSLKMFLV